MLEGLPEGSKDPSNRVVGPKYHNILGIWVLKPHYLSPWTLKVRDGLGKLSCFSSEDQGFGSFRVMHVSPYQYYGHTRDLDLRIDSGVPCTSLPLLYHPCMGPLMWTQLRVWDL